MITFIELLNKIVWGIPALLLIVGVGVFLTVRTGVIQLRLFPKALKNFACSLKSNKDGDHSSFRALCTALAATVGTGNLAGVAGAIAIGGPGSIFWMWVCGLLGMVTKFAEATLSVRFRQHNSKGEWVGGPMYMIKNGLHRRWHFLAWIYCFFGVIAAFGVGNATQINALIGGVNSTLELFGTAPSFRGNLLMGFLLSALICIMLMGGARRIGRIAEIMVPVSAALYLILGIGVLVTCASNIPSAIASIFQGAFNPGAATGGIVGSGFQALRVGASRGVFTNEAGMGTAGIAHGAAKVEHPAAQGLMGIMEVFLDTIVICTVTALVILCSGVVIPYGTDTGITLTAQAFSNVYGDWVRIPIALALCSFAIATVLGWGLYGARCAQFLFGESVWMPFVALQGVTVVLGAVLGTGTVWMLSETVNGLMAIPNLITLALLSPEIVRLANAYKQMC